ncbi:MAG: hypothetical protein ACI8Y8_002248 [Planctomycetota bacterium]|jgi:hypothetical protein
MMKKLLLLAPLLVAGWCFLGPEPGMPTEKLATSELVATISHGEAVDLDEHLAPGKWTLVEYGAKW